MNAAAAIALVFFAEPSVDPSAAVATRAAVNERLTRGGQAVADLSAEHRALSTKTPFVDFTAPPPAFLPPEVATAWKKGSEACAQQTGPTGPELAPGQRSASAAHAHVCAWALGLAIWPMFLDARGVKRVVSVELKLPLDPKGNPRGVTAITSLFGPGRSLRVLQADDLGADRVAAEVTRALEDLLAGGGKPVKPMHLAVPSVGVPWLEEEKFGEPRKAVVPGWCKGLPARLEVFPPGKVARAIEADYRTAPTDRRTAAPLRCDLVLSPGYDLDSEPLADARLRCPPVQYRAGALRGDGPEMVGILVSGVVAELCTAQRLQPASPGAPPAK